ncbi:hypothetical protein B7P43_G14134 [Cryptotermes secundus]|nr:hypothetical protein B7P43_G14134 [Cryptotermes secundus]PNF22884.1 hypothetical protein B7P43_G14134 [Cryptotermes secundus]PNF22887.1 hypothetical protein B7P43_G14134 [Cryptotermes secundus]
MQTQRKVLQHNVSVLEEEKKILQEQILSVEKMSEEKTEQINDLEREKERLLSELVQSASQREKEMQLIREVYEGRLKEAANKAMIVEQDLSAVMAEADERRKDALEISQVNKCLKQQLQEAQIIISEKEQSVVQIASERTSLEADLKKAGDAQKKLIKHNEYLSARVMEIENESASLSLQLQELNIQHERKVHFRNIFTDLEHRIINLEMKQEEIIASKNVQLERIDTIAERLSKLDVKAQTLHSEREDVAATRDIQESELARMVGNLTSLKERLKKNYLMQFDMHDDFSIETLQATVSELDAFVESSKMRISDLDQQIKEVEEEKSVLMQQQSHALEKKNEYKRREGEVHQELVELHEHEREIRQEHGGQLTALQDQCDDVSDGNNDMLAAGLTPGGKVAVAKMEKVDLQEKLQESNDSSLEQQCSSPNVTDMNTCLKQEQELKLRLQLAAAEYRKLYTEKQKVERRLTKLYHKMNEKKLKSSSALEQSKASPVAREQPVTGELISLSQAAVAGSENRTALPSQEKGGPVSCFLCPVCSVTFPRGAYDLFTQHFEAHLS